MGGNITHRALNLYGINVKGPQYLMLNGLTCEAYEEEYGDGPHAGDSRRPTLVQALRIYGKLRPRWPPGLAFFKMDMYSKIFSQNCFGSN